MIALATLTTALTLTVTLIANAVIAYENDNWQAAVSYRNLFDVDYIENVFNSRGGSNYPGEGFTVVGSFSVRF